MFRKDDNIRRLPVRGERYFKLHDFWYFATREGAMLGPYDSKEQAERATRDFIEFVQSAPPAAFRLLEVDHYRLSA
jgi:hypothetical protein